MKNDLEIPKFLRRKVSADWEKRREALIAEHRNPTITIRSNGSHRDFYQPKGVSDEEWAERKAAKEAVAKAKRDERFAALKATAEPRKPKREGLIGIGEIAKEMGMIARDARMILRKAMAKPSVGWAFTPGAAVKDVKALLKKGVKK